MITKLLVPIVDLNRARFDYGRDITDEEAAAMEVDKFRRTNRQIGTYVNNMMYRSRGINVTEERRRRNDFSNVLDENEYVECEAYFADSKKKEIFEDFFEEHNNGKKFIMTININPNSLEQEAESEIRYWRDDSNGVLNDKTLDNQTKIDSLMERNLGVEVNGKKYGLSRCKIICDYSTKEFPFYYGVLVDSITEFNFR